jgi:glutathione S-transferase
MTRPTITAFKASPDRGRGLARDMPVRWALEEAGQPYDVRLEAFAQLKQTPHLTHQPFGQIPTYQDGALDIFETGAIVLHIAEQSGVLLPADADARMRAITWMFAALVTVQQPVVEREATILMERDKPWTAERMPMLDERVTTRLAQLANRLGDANWLDGDFSAGDLMMVAVLRRPASRNLLGGFATLEAYVSRAEARPAFQRAFAAQKQVFEDSQAAQ